MPLVDVLELDARAVRAHGGHGRGERAEGADDRTASTPRTVDGVLPERVVRVVDAAPRRAALM